MNQETSADSPDCLRQSEAENQNPSLDSPEALENAYSILREYRIHAIQVLGEVLTTGKPSDQLNAAESILNRTGIPQTKTTIHETPTPSLSPDTLKTIFSGIANMFLSANLSANVRSSNEEHTPIKDITPDCPDCLRQSDTTSKKPLTLASDSDSLRKSDSSLKEPKTKEPKIKETSSKEVPEEILNSLSSKSTGDYL